MAIKKRQQAIESESEQEEEYGYDYDSQDDQVMYCLINLEITETDSN
jgi:Skp family chaperone for outer membrane proteins